MVEERDSYLIFSQCFERDGEGRRSVGDLRRLGFSLFFSLEEGIGKGREGGIEIICWERRSAPAKKFTHRRLICTIFD